MICGIFRPPYPLATPMPTTYYRQGSIYLKKISTIVINLKINIWHKKNLTQFGDNARQNKVFFHIMAHNDLHVHLDAILKSPPDLKDETLLPMIESLHEKVNSVVDDLT